MAPAKSRGGGGGKKGGGGGGAKGAADLDRRKDELVAVVLADSFAQTFRPITLETPKALLPLAGSPLLDYALEWLAGSGCVDEVVVVACAHARQVEAHLAAAGWTAGGGAGGGGGRAGPAVRVSCVACPTARSAGDALRELDVRGTLAGASDFLLMHADVVTNADLGAALAAHRARRAGPDPGAVATLLVAGGVTPAQRARLGEAAVVYTLDAASGRLLAFDDLGGGPAGAGGASPGAPPPTPPPAYLRVDARAFSERDACAVRADLSRPHAALCGPEVLVAFADNFDFQAVDRDFIPGTLAEEELGQRLYLHIVAGTGGRGGCGGGSGGGGIPGCSPHAKSSGGAYLARVTCLRSYDAVSRDVLQRWAFPLALDTNLLPAPSGGGAWKGEKDGGVGGAGGGAGGGPATPPPATAAAVVATAAAAAAGPAPAPLATTYRAGRHFTYREAGVSVARGGSLGPDAAAGAGATLGEGAAVRCSVLGRGAAVGRAARVTGSYLLAGAVVGEGAAVAGSLLCEGAVVGAGAVVGPGAVIGRRCVIAARAVVPPGERVSLFRRVGTADGEDGSTSDEGEAATDGGEEEEEEGCGGRSDGGGGPSGGLGSDSGGSRSTAAALAAALAPRPPADVDAAATAAAAGVAPSPALGFDARVVGSAGAGYAWGPAPGGPAWSLAPHATAVAAAAPPPPPAPSTPAGFAPFGADDGWDSDAAAAAGRGGGAGAGGRGGGGGAGAHPGAAPPAPLDAEAAADAARAAAAAVFRSEVAETFARVAREGISDDNAAIELNSLKIAEDKAFADAAAALATAVLSLAGPPPPGTPPEDAPLYAPPDSPAAGPPDAPGAAAALLARVKALLAAWGPLLRRFVRDDDDGVEVLLALEEWVSGEQAAALAGGGGDAGRARGAHHGAAGPPGAGLAAAGPRFAGLWPFILKAMYDADILEEAPLLAWADEKDGAPPEERVWLDRAADFIAWLREAESGSEEEGGSE